MDLELTLLAIDGYVKEWRENGAGPDQLIAVPLKLSQWEEILKASRPEELPRDIIAQAVADLETVCMGDIPDDLGYLSRVRDWLSTMNKESS
jgi:hypothetical protein